MSLNTFFISALFFLMILFDTCFCLEGQELNGYWALNDKCANYAGVSLLISGDQFCYENKSDVIIIKSATTIQLQIFSGKTKIIDNKILTLIGNDLNIQYFYILRDNDDLIWGLFPLQDIGLLIIKNELHNEKMSSMILGIQKKGDFKINEFNSNPKSFNVKINYPDINSLQSESLKKSINTLKNSLNNTKPE